MDTLPPARPPATRPWLSAAGLLAAAILAIGLNLLTDRLAPRARLDLTEQRLYTLSEGTRSVLRSLRDPITLRLFYSRRLGAAIPAYGAYAERVRALLEEYVAVAGGKLRLEILDPEPFSETEDRALAYGLQGVPLDQSGEQIYFGLVGINASDDERIIAFFQPERERFLEYELTRLIYELSHPQRPTVGVITSLPLNGDPRMLMMMRGVPAAQPFAVMQMLHQFFTIEDLPLDTPRIADTIQVLMVVHPQGLPETTLYAIDQFVMRGGKLIVFVDPHAEGQATRSGALGGVGQRTSSELDRLLTAWGIEVPGDSVVADLRGAWRVRASPTDRVQAVDYIAWFNLQGDSLNPDEIVTAQLNQVTVAAAGTVRLREGATVAFVPLLRSSERSMLIPAERVRDNPDPARLLAEFRPEHLRRTIAARIRGHLPSAFPDGPPLPAEGTQTSTPPPQHRSRSEGIAHVVVIADADILEDRFWVRVQDFFGRQVVTPFSDNGAFIANLIDVLAGGESLIGLRSRGESLRPFTVIDDLRREADARFRQTERELQATLEQLERRLRELRQGTGGERSQGSAVITPEQRVEIDTARAQILDIRRQLRTVQLELRRDIERLELWLKILNIAAVPLLLTALAIALGLARARQRARSSP